MQQDNASDINKKRRLRYFGNLSRMDNGRYPTDTSMDREEEEGHRKNGSTW